MEYSIQLQNLHFKFLEGKEYDVLQSNELHHFRHILEFYIKSTEIATNLSKKIVQSSNLYYQIIIVNCIVDATVFSVPVIRVRQNGKQVVFYDIWCRKYKDWEDYLSNNQLPKCKMVFPENGVYKMENGKVKLGERKSPACGLGKAICEGLYVVAKVVSVLALHAPDFKVLQPYNTAIVGVTALTNGYATCHDAYQLFDRANHDQSIHYSDEKATACWMSIGTNLLSFAITAGKVKYGSPQSEELALKNLLLMCKEVLTSNDMFSSLTNTHRLVLAQHLTYFKDQAIVYFDENIVKSEIDAKEFIFNLKRYVLKDSSVTSTFRRILYTDCVTLRAVSQDMELARKIPKLFRMELCNITMELNAIVDKIMQEVKNWADGNASNMQFLFRVSRMCNGLKSYETVEEMCNHFNVSQPEDIKENGKYLFVESGKKFLELYNESDIVQRPQLLSYTVEYLSSHSNVDLEDFWKYFNERVANELSMSVSSQSINKEREWINARTLENLSYANSVPHEEINLVKPKPWNEAEITVIDLFKLAKRLLGRVGDIDMKLVRPDVNWVIVASKVRGFSVIIAPKINLEEFGSIGGCYPVFKRPF